MTGKRIASIHDHSNNVRTVGIGEIIAVMNGIEFRTRHNDYRLYMPANTPEYHATQNIPFPEVPPEVLALESNISEAVGEMIEWFKAWRDQDYSVRDYRKYFKPILCYMEGRIFAFPDRDARNKLMLVIELAVNWKYVYVCEMSLTESYLS